MRFSPAQTGRFFLIAALAAGLPLVHSTAQTPDTGRSLATVARNVPIPEPAHPGNVFQEKEDVVIPPPDGLPEGVIGWRIVDDKGQVVTHGTSSEESRIVDARTLGIGWYRVEYVNDNGERLAWTTAAVVAKLAEPVPQDSPVCVDSATAWFARSDAARQERFARLAALAGVNWIRDRLSWGEVETARGAFADHTSYDTSADVQAKHGLKTLQVFHSTPGWAVDEELDAGDRHRFPRDLRDQYSFCRAMAQRYKGRVLAWEPWNEANITHFGGHTIDEMCALQKAAYFGFKADDPDLVVCWNVFAGSGTRLHTEGVLLNEAWPYFETYNIHSYGRPSSYLNAFEGPREAASGRPIWISECGVRLPYVAEDGWGELSPEDEIRQAEFIAQSYASSLFAGVDRHFFFILGNYLERGIQFGLLRRDQTPRPGYVALAAVGRFLAGGRCLGRLSGEDEVNVYAFRARPDGVAQDLLIAWGEKPVAWPAGATVNSIAAYDYLGRAIGAAVPEELGTAPIFVVLAPGEAGKLDLESQPQRAPYREGAASPVVLQAQMAQAAVRLAKQAYEVEPGAEVEVPVFAYNFSAEPVEGTLGVEQAPLGWRVSLPGEPIELAAGERRRLPVRVHVPRKGKEVISGAWLRLRGDFGAAGRPVLAFRLCGQMDKIEPDVAKILAGANDPARWEDNIVQRARMKHEAAQDGVAFEMDFSDTDPWGYPRLRLQAEEIPDGQTDGLAVTIQVLEGKGTVRVQFIEEGGAAYATDLGVKAEERSPQRAVALFEGASWGSYSRPDSNGKLDPAEIRAVLVGINSEKHTTVKMVVGDLAWVSF